MSTLLVLAGGDGTRLKAVTGNISKPLIKIGGTQVITRVLNKLVIELEISNVHLLIQKKHIDQYTEYIKSLSLIKEVDIKLAVENKKLGTGGSIKNFLKHNKINEFFVTNADTLIKNDIREFTSSKINSVLCTNLENQKRFGSVTVDENNKITDFRNKDESKNALVNAGIYKLERSIFSLIDESVFDLETTLFPICSEIGLLHCFSLKIDFEDIGIPDAYYRALEQHKKEVINVKK